jgi:hypothetical protein
LNGIAPNPAACTPASNAERSNELTSHFLTIIRYTYLASLLAGLALVSHAPAQLLRITPPATAATLKHDETDADQSFAPQRWAVASTHKRGARVVFSTEHAFTHTADPTIKRDARLDLAIASADWKARWRITVARDQTEHAAAVPYETASVQAESRKKGAATFDLRVTFLTDNYDSLAAGEYGLTVIGTLTAN